MDQVHQGQDPSRNILGLCASKALQRNKNTIKMLWEKRVREQILAAQDKTSIVMLESLDIFLEELAIVLAQRISSSKIFSEEGMAKLHGGQRAILSGYFLPQLLKEFSLLREVIIEVLHNQGMLTFDARRLIDKSIDSAISLAATEFTKVQDAGTKAALVKAEMSNRDLEHFAAVAAHDLKSPLATISGYLSLLDDEFKEKLEKDSLQYIEFMNKASTRMLNLIDRILDYARLAKEDRPFRPVNINDIVKITLQNLSHNIEKTHAEITHETMPTVIGDSELLTQLFQNLIANGIKFHGDTPPKIQIATEEKNGSWLFSVSDNGIGFDPESREDIFALYKKLHGETQYQGAGIGLATCRKVVELHGGTIWANSKLDRGATFYFTLPMAGTKRANLPSSVET